MEIGVNWSWPEEADKEVVRRERHFGRFSRVPVPEGVDPEKIGAKTMTAKAKAG